MDLDLKEEEEEGFLSVCTVMCVCDVCLCVWVCVMGQRYWWVETSAFLRNHTAERHCGLAVQRVWLDCKCSFAARWESVEGQRCVLVASLVPTFCLASSAHRVTSSVSGHRGEGGKRNWQEKLLKKLVMALIQEAFFHASVMEGILLGLSCQD